MYMLVKLRSNPNEVYNIEKQLDSTQFRGGTTIIIGYESRIKWEKHLEELLRHRVHITHVNQIDSLRDIMDSKNLPMVVVKTDNDNVKIKLESNGFKRLDSILKH